MTSLSDSHFIQTSVFKHSLDEVTEIEVRTVCVLPAAGQCRPSDGAMFKEYGLYAIVHRNGDEVHVMRFAYDLYRAHQLAYGEPSRVSVRLASVVSEELTQQGNAS